MPRDEIIDNLTLVAEWLGVKHPRKHFELVVVGGSAMALLGMPKTTADVDVLIPARLPLEILNAARVVGKAKGLGPDWLNDRAADALAVSCAEKERPAYFLERSLSIPIADNLTVHVIGR
ncbi:MAG: hypothetical protein H7Z43_02590 [Clostridia bacterium]|nr:hypothetical protein [Deltaproteobacteria bacterium]